MAVKIDSDSCIGCGVCMQICPDVFGLDEEAGKATLLEPNETSEKADFIKEAIDSCPIGCISE
ncbi:MAG: ferredoxin [Synergistaceae bacterium]|nr:ferredoxin [Synergistaceae bacterium]